MKRENSEVEEKLRNLTSLPNGIEALISFLLHDANSAIVELKIKSRHAEFGCDRSSTPRCESEFDAL